jgi:membrane protein implicated in regulation of membrane protease activity
VAPAPRAGGLRVLGKYALFQVPGWLVVGSLAWSAHRWWGLDGWLAAAACGAWVLKDVALYPFVRHAYGVGSRPAESELLGARAVAREPVAPEGFVRLGRELWRARLARGAAPVAAGEAVRVEAVEGLTLRVRAESEAAPDTDP